MSVAPSPQDRPTVDHDFVKQAISLLSQQLWCWGRDILRPDGNWLLEIGFDRVQPPGDLEDCASVYTLALPRGRSVVLRGFGVFFGDQRRGGVFLPRFEFRPQYTTHATLDCPPWTDSDLPKLNPPDDSQRNDCVALTLDLVDWIRRYEFDVLNRLGLEYRRSTLGPWDNGKRALTPAEKFASAWRELSFRIAANPDVLWRPAEA